MHVCMPVNALRVCLFLCCFFSYTQNGTEDGSSNGSLSESLLEVLENASSRNGYKNPLQRHMGGKVIMGGPGGQGSSGPPSMGGVLVKSIASVSSSSDYDRERVTDYPVAGHEGNNRTSLPHPGGCSPVISSRHSSITTLNHSDSLSAMSDTSEGSFSYDASRRPKKKILKDSRSSSTRKSKNRVRWNLGNLQDGDSVSVSSIDVCSVRSADVFQRARESVQNSTRNWREFEDTFPPRGSTGLTPWAPRNANSLNNRLPLKRYDSPPPVSDMNGGLTLHGVPLGVISPPRKGRPGPGGAIAHSTPIRRYNSDLSSLSQNHAVMATRGSGRRLAPLGGSGPDPFGGGFRQISVSESNQHIPHIPVLKICDSSLEKLEESTMEDRKEKLLFEFPQGPLPNQTAAMAASPQTTRSNQQTSSAVSLRHAGQTHVSTTGKPPLAPPLGTSNGNGGDDDDDDDDANDYDHLLTKEEIERASASSEGKDAKEAQAPAGSSLTGASSSAGGRKEVGSDDVGYSDNDINEALKLIDKSKELKELKELKESPPSSKKAKESPTPPPVPPHKRKTQQQQIQQQTQTQTQQVSSSKANSKGMTQKGAGPLPPPLPPKTKRILRSDRDVMGNPVIIGTGGGTAHARNPVAVSSSSLRSRGYYAQHSIPTISNSKQQEVMSQPPSVNKVAALRENFVSSRNVFVPVSEGSTVSSVGRSSSDAALVDNDGDESTTILPPPPEFASGNSSTTTAPSGAPPPPPPSALVVPLPHTLEDIDERAEDDYNRVSRGSMEPRHSGGSSSNNADQEAMDSLSNTTLVSNDSGGHNSPHNSQSPHPPYPSYLTSSTTSSTSSSISSSSSSEKQGVKVDDIVHPDPSLPSSTTGWKPVRDRFVEGAENPSSYYYVPGELPHRGDGSSTTSGSSSNNNLEKRMLHVSDSSSESSLEDVKVAHLHSSSNGSGSGSAVTYTAVEERPGRGAASHAARVRSVGLRATTEGREAALRGSNTNNIGHHQQTSSSSSSNMLHGGGGSGGTIPVALLNPLPVPHAHHPAPVSMPFHSHQHQHQHSAAGGSSHSIPQPRPLNSSGGGGGISGQHQIGIGTAATTAQHQLHKSVSTPVNLNLSEEDRRVLHMVSSGRLLPMRPVVTDTDTAIEDMIAELEQSCLKERGGGGRGGGGGGGEGEREREREGERGEHTVSIPPCGELLCLVQWDVRCFEYEEVHNNYYDASIRSILLCSWHFH